MYIYISVCIYLSLYRKGDKERERYLQTEMKIQRLHFSIPQINT